MGNALSFLGLPPVAEGVPFTNSDAVEDIGEYDKYAAADQNWTDRNLEKTEYFSPRIAAMVLKSTSQCEKTHWSTVEDGRFAFRMLKAWGDLRRLIDLAMQKNSMRGPPFPFELGGVILRAEFIMLLLAEQMVLLHEKGVFHKDLKASNILLFSSSLYPVVADYECSIGVEGTGFWRAPEVLSALKDSARPIVFTEKMDVYAFGMTCYEIVTGRLPFEGELLRPILCNFEVVMGREGLRPKLPSDSDIQVKDLIVRCWDWDPNVRPTFSELVGLLSSIDRQ